MIYYVFGGTLNLAQLTKCYSTKPCGSALQQEHDNMIMIQLGPVVLARIKSGSIIAEGYGLLLIWPVATYGCQSRTMKTTEESHKNI